MIDNLPINMQIPPQLQEYFTMEEKFRFQIAKDENVFKFKKVYLITEETIINNNWDGLYLSQQFKQRNVPEFFSFEDNLSSHLKLYVNE